MLVFELILIIYVFNLDNVGIIIFLVFIVNNICLMFILKLKFGVFGLFNFLIKLLYWFFV